MFSWDVEQASVLVFNEDIVQQGIKAGQAAAVEYFQKIFSI